MYQTGSAAQPAPLPISSQIPGQNSAMGNFITREEVREIISDKIQVSEARLDTKLVGLEAKMDRLIDKVDTAVTASKEAKQAAEGAHTASSNIKWNIFFTAVATIGLLATFWALTMQGMDFISSLLTAAQ